MSKKALNHNVLKADFNHATHLIKLCKDCKLWIVLAETLLDTSSAILLTALFVVIAWFSQATFTSPSSEQHITKLWEALLWLGVSDTLAILRLLQSVLTAGTTFAVWKSFDVIAWILTTRAGGIETLLFLGLSSSTGIWGILGLLCSKHVRVLERFAAVSRLVFLLIIWLSGVLLFAKTQLTQVNRTLTTYNVTGGVGVFRGSYVAEYLGHIQEVNPTYNSVILPYSILTAAAQIVVNPAYSLSANPVKPCVNKTQCNSYLLPGGLLTATPWPPIDHDEYPTITIHRAPAAQLDFVRVTKQEEEFVESRDCLSYGSGQFTFGIQFCLAESVLNPGSLLAGVFVCQDGIKDDKCQMGVNPPKLLTSFTVYQLQATTTSARLNMSILAAQDLSPPIQQVGLNISALKQSFTWLFNASAADIPLTSSPVQYFWTVQKQLSQEYWIADAYRTFHSLLAFPFWHFNDNNFGNIRLDPETITTTLPKEFMTYAAIDKPMSKISVDGGMFIAFCILQAICIIFIWMTLIIRWFHHFDMPEISSYPLIDFNTKTYHHDEYGPNSVLVEPTTNKDVKRALTISSGDKVVRQSLKNDITMICMMPDTERVKKTVIAMPDEVNDDAQQTLLHDQNRQDVELTTRATALDAGKESDIRLRAEAVSTGVS